MKKSFIFIACILLLVGCGDKEKNQGEEVTETIIDKPLASAQNEFAWNLFQAVETGEENVFISPFSVFVALGMTANGADGETKKEIIDTLEAAAYPFDQFNEEVELALEALEKETDTVTFQSANAAWLNDQFSFDQDFLERVETNFKAKIEEIDISDPATVDQVNDWVKEQTNNKIEELIDGPLDPLLVLMLMNAVYFQGDWQYEFIEGETREETFYGIEEELVDMMVVEENFFYKEEDDFDIVQLPYGEGEMSMYVMLPNENVTLEAMQESFSYENFEELREEMQEMRGIVKLPKFKMEYEVDLKDALVSLGMEKAFDPDEADFSKMITTEDPLWIDFVQHKTFIEVDEKGTEAAAVTNVGIKTMSAIEEEVFTMEMNRPFQFIIMDESTDHILFIGNIKEVTEK